MLRLMFGILTLTLLLAWWPVPATTTQAKSPLAQKLQSVEGQQLLHDFCTTAGTVAATAVEARDSGMPSSAVIQRIIAHGGLNHTENAGFIAFYREIVLYVYQVKPGIQAPEARQYFKTFCDKHMAQAVREVH